MTTEERKIANDGIRKFLAFTYYLWSNPRNLIFAFKVAKIRLIEQHKTVYRQSRAAISTDTSFEKMMGF